MDKSIIGNLLSRQWRILQGKHKWKDVGFHLQTNSLSLPFLWHIEGTYKKIHILITLCLLVEKSQVDEFLLVWASIEYSALHNQNMVYIDRTLDYPCYNNSLAFTFTAYEIWNFQDWNKAWKFENCIDNTTTTCRYTKLVEERIWILKIHSVT